MTLVTFEKHPPWGHSNLGIGCTGQCLTLREDHDDDRPHPIELNLMCFSGKRIWKREIQNIIQQVKWNEGQVWNLTSASWQTCCWCLAHCIVMWGGDSGSVTGMWPFKSHMIHWNGTVSTHVTATACTNAAVTTWAPPTHPLPQALLDWSHLRDPIKLVTCRVNTEHFNILISTWAIWHRVISPKSKALATVFCAF